MAAAEAATAAPGAAQAAPGASAAAPAADASSSLLGILGESLKDLPGLLNDRVELLSLELQRAGMALVKIVGLTLAAAILLLTGWLAMWALLVMALVAMGLPMVASLAVALLLNVGAAVWALWQARHLLPLLRLPATRRHLMISPSPPSGAGSHGPDRNARTDTAQPVAS
jgi:uncharacterized membrane protein YqjE